MKTIQKGYSGGVRARRLGALKRLEEQLNGGFKTPKKTTSPRGIRLTDEDISRINKEISILKSKL